MDIIAHAVYGATVCSQKGLAGGRVSDNKRRWYEDVTVYQAALFGVIPDVVSMWPSFLVFIWEGMPGGNFFAWAGGATLIWYHATHSLVVALPACLILGLFRRSLFLPSLAWPLHVIMDAPTHGIGKFQTQPFFPLLDWGVTGINWWEHPGVFAGYWIALPLIWVFIRFWRRRAFFG